MAEEVRLSYGCISDKSSQRFYLNIFKHTGLVETGKIWVDVLEKCFKYGISFDIDVYDFVEGEYGGRMESREQSYSLETLLEECVEVQEFAKKHFPEHTI